MTPTIANGDPEHSPWFIRLQNARWMRSVQFMSQYRMKEILAAIVILGSFGLGLSMVSVPLRFLAQPNLAITFGWAKPEFWGSVFILLSCLLGVAMGASRRQGMWPALGLTILYGAFSISVVLSPEHTLPTTIWFTFIMSMLCAALTVSCVFHINLKPPVSTSTPPTSVTEQKE